MNHALLTTAAKRKIHWHNRHNATKFSKLIYFEIRAFSYKFKRNRDHLRFINK